MGRGELAGAALALALLLPAACSHDGPVQGIRGACANATGDLIGCDPAAIETPEDACWRLVDCGVIPLDFPDDINPNQFDWENCVELVEGLPDWNLQHVLDCVQASSCEDLRAPDSPLSPDDLPLCLRYTR